MISAISTKTTVSTALGLLLSLPILHAQLGDRAGHVMDPPPKEWTLPAPPLSPSQALDSFQLEDGFELQLVAAEPLVINPVCVTFDGNGRPWVCEMRAYMPTVDGEGEDEKSGRISILEDTDGDGQADEAKVFLDGLVLPRALQFVEGGILWADQDNLYFTERLEGDKAGETTVIDDKWAPSGNVEHKANGLLYGLDNWIYNAKHDRRYRMVDGEWVQEETEFRGQWGISQDDFGHLVTNTNSSLIAMETLPPSYTMRNPNHKFSSTKVERMNNAVHPIRYTTGVNRGYMEKTLDDEGRLANATGACGPVIYRGDNFPDEYYGNAFICEPTGLLVKRAILKPDGLGLNIEAAYPDREFIASNDERNRFVNAYTAPDGSLYLVDMYHGIIQHKTYVTTYLREQILERDLDEANNDKGRIYRVAYTGKDLGKLPKMEKESSIQLVGHLDHPNGWWRDTAQRLIVQRQDTSGNVLDALRKRVAGVGDSTAQVHAIWCLEGLGELEDSDVELALRSEDPKVVANAVRVAESLAGRRELHTAEVLAKAAETNASPEADLQLAASLGMFREDGIMVAQSTLVKVLQRNDDKLYRDMAMSGLAGVEAQFAQLAAADDLKILEDLAVAVVNGGKLDEVAQVMDLVSDDEKLVKKMATTALASRKAPVAAQLLTTADVHEELREPIVEGLINGGKTKGYKTMALKARPSFLTKEYVSKDKQLASLDKLFDFSGHGPVSNLKTEADREQFKLGSVEYAKLCIACHQPQGQGMVNMAPPLVDSEWVTGPENRLIALVMDGVMGPIEVNGTLYEAPQIQPVMPGLRMNPELSDEKMAAILTFVRNSWGNSAPPVSAEAVAKFRKDNAMRAPYTAEELMEVK